MLGYTPVPIEKLVFLPGAEVREGKIIKQGVEWTVMEASQETLNRLYDIYIARQKSRRSGGEHRVEQFVQRREMIDDNQNARNRYVMGREQETGTPRALSISHWRASALANSNEPGSIQIDFQSQGIQNPVIIRLPSNLPIAQGEWRLHEGRTKVTYHGNVLTSITVDETPGYSMELTIQIRISPDLQAVHSLVCSHKKLLPNLIVSCSSKNVDEFHHHEIPSL